jgi:hypothetical protein
MELASHYGENFYQDQGEESLRSARIVARYLWNYLQPASVIDIGCGRGHWLKAFGELGSQCLVGLDGDWNSQSQMTDPAIRFRAVDLNQRFAADEKAELAISMEVAEHLPATSASLFVESLTGTSDAVLFSAAYTWQGGTNHLNERPHTYWAQLFGERGFVPFDLFRPALWGNDEVAFWYRQNAFLYCKRDSASYRALQSKGCAEMTELSFMDCIHPEMYNLRCRRIDVGFMEHVKDIGPSLFRALRRRMKRDASNDVVTTKSC